MENYLYHGIVDWLNYNKENKDDELCLKKLESILKTRYIVRPCDFKLYGIKHGDCANVYTYYFTFAACHPNSKYSNIFKKDLKEDNGYMVATEYSKFGILLDPVMIEELKIADSAFCDKEILFLDNISLDKYAIGIYINLKKITNEVYCLIKNMIKKYNYNFYIVNIEDGNVIDYINNENSKIKKMA